MSPASRTARNDLMHRDGLPRRSLIVVISCSYWSRNKQSLGKKLEEGKAKPTGKKRNLTIGRVKWTSLVAERHSEYPGA